MNKKSMVIPTYIVGKPDPNPIFYTGRAYQGAKGPIYPYPMLDKITDTREDRTYNSLMLENEYIRVCVLPEIGGRVFFAEDKTNNNYPFIYRQHVIKPALIGMLGAWISGGIEWNFPHHHRATTFMPVNYELRSNPDGSKTIWIGEIEIRHRMKWSIGLTLYPGKSYLEATVKLFNRTPLAHSMLFWANAAVHCNENYQVIFPPRTEYATYHGKNQFSRWPISYEVFNGVDYTKGVDVSWWKNHPNPTSYFAWNYEDDFFGGYDHGKRAGTLHVADHYIVPGKKFFAWGNGPHGQMWEKILTETDGPYLELMTGAYSDNQPDYSWIMPYEVRTFKEYWYPIREIGGVKYANINGAVNLEVHDGLIKIGFNTTSEYKNAKVILKLDGKIVFQERIDIGPDRPYVKEIQITPDVKEENLEVLLFTSENSELISYKPLKKAGAPMPKPVETPSPPEKIKTNEELYLTGLRLEQFHNPALEPYPYYEEALRRDPDDYRVNTALGILYCKRGMFREAEEKLKRAIKRVTKNYTTPKDGEAYYYLGVALRYQGRYDEAYEAFQKATWCYSWCSASYYALAELECVRGNFVRALEFVERSLLANGLNTKAMNLKAILFRKLGKFKEAEELVLRVLEIDPLDFWARNELYLLKSRKSKDSAAKELRALIRLMRDETNSYLELAADYSSCGLYDEAANILLRLVKRARMQGKEVYPLIYYHLGYYLEHKGDESKAQEYYLLGSKSPPDYCFPFQLESIEILHSAIKRNPNDARAHYYLGNLLYDMQPENAISEWERAKDLGEEYYILYRNLGFGYARIENNIPKAIESYEQALKLNPKDPRLYLEMDQLYETAGISPDKRLRLLEKNHEVVITKDETLLREIQLLIQVGRYDDAISILSNHHFHVWEGSTAVHDMYVLAHLMRGDYYFANKKYDAALKDYEAALEYPENLEVGGEWDGGWFPRIYCSIGKVYEATNNQREANKFYEKAVTGQYDWSEMSFYQATAYRKLGNEEKAVQIFNGLIKAGEEKLKSSLTMSFFEKFGEKQTRSSIMADAHYLMGLGYLGRNMCSEAIKEFEEVLKLNRNHVGAKMHLNELKALDERTGERI
jgi:tetratricopeptide (TPR) repeat protein